jgi:hypothetical protein
MVGCRNSLDLVSQLHPRYVPLAFLAMPLFVLSSSLYSPITQKGTQIRRVSLVPVGNQGSCKQAEISEG